VLLFVFIVSQEVLNFGKNSSRFVWLNSPEQAGTYALVSIGISAMTTGFTSAMIAFDMDVDVPHRRSQPLFYGK